MSLMIENGLRVRIAELEAERDNLFDRLHIEHLVNEWFAPLGFEVTQSHVDGLCDVLRKRLGRARPAP